MNQTSENSSWKSSKNAEYINKFGVEFNLPNPQEPLWRYQSFARFEQLLNEKTLYLSRIDRFWDFREGSTTDASVEHAASQVQRLSIDWDKGTIDKHATTEAEGAWVASLSGAIGHLSTKNAYHACCWNRNTVESSLMWRSYGSPSSDDRHLFKVAIKTKALSLINSLDISQIEGQIYFGPVKYLDYKLDRSASQNINTNVFQKKHEYATENEIRLAVFNDSYLPSGYPVNVPKSPLGMTIPTTINELIEEVYVEAVPTLDKEPEHLQQEIEDRLKIVKSSLSQAGLGTVKITLSEIL